MQQKVSIIMPCYNKVELIGKAFDSIIAQEWDNIELVLVNDGSTDGTRDVIAAYKSDFDERGFDVVIIDQENQGLAAAVFNGLARCTGEFLCQLDADDELEPLYVSIMAGWLTENPDYDWAACDSSLVTENSVIFRKSFPNGEKDCKIENWILRSIMQTLWIYMIRRDYLIRCNVMKSYHIAKDAYQEQQVIFPLISGGGRLKYFNIPLHRQSFFERENHLSFHVDYESTVNGFREKYNTTRSTLNQLNEANADRQRLDVLNEISFPLETIAYLNYWEINTHDNSEHKNRLIKLFNDFFTVTNPIDSEHIFDNIELFRRALVDNIMGVRPKRIYSRSGRIVAWGALGRNAERFLPLLEGTSLEPTELWDVSGGSEKVKCPNIESLSENDIVLILPAMSNDICKSLEANNFTNYITAPELPTAITFPQFYDGRVMFNY